MSKSKMQRRIERGRMTRRDFRANRVAHDAAKQHGRAMARRIVGARIGSGGRPLLARAMRRDDSRALEMVLPEIGDRVKRDVEDVKEAA